MSAPEPKTYSPDPPPLVLVQDAVVRAEFGISAMTLHRWDNDASLGFPGAVVIRGRKFRFRDQLEAFKANLIAAAASGEATTIAPTPPHWRSAKSRASAGRS